MANITFTQGVENGKFLIKLFSSDIFSTTNSLNMNFSYTSSALSFSKIVFSGSSSIQSNSSQVGNLGSAQLTGQFISNASAGQPFATLEFSGNGSGTFNLDFSTLTINGGTAAYIDPPATTYSIVSVDDTSNIVLNEDTSFANGYNPFDSFFGSTLQVATQAKHGTVSIVKDGFDSHWNYVPTANYHGADTFSVLAIDGLQEKKLKVSVSVTSVNDAPTGKVTISGTPEQGSMLTASNTLADVDGIGTINYQWKAAGVNISGATRGTFDLTAAQIGKPISVTVSYKDDYGTESVTSSQTTAIGPANSYSSIVQKFYISYFGRPADPDGLQSMTNQLKAANAPYISTDAFVSAYGSNATVKTIIDNFGTSAESAALYSGSTTEFVTAIYDHVLGRTPDSGGLAYWTNAIDNGSLARGTAALTIMAGAENNTSPQGLIDAALVANRVKVAANFTMAIDTAAEKTGYSGNAAAAVIRSMLNNVNQNTVVSDFQMVIEDYLGKLISTPTTSTTPIGLIEKTIIDLSEMINSGYLATDLRTPITRITGAMSLSSTHEIVSHSEYIDNQITIVGNMQNLELA